MVKRLNEIMERKTALLEELKGDLTEERTAEIEKETEALVQEEGQLRTKMDLTARLGKPVGKPADRADKNELEQRGTQLRDSRSVTIASGELIKPKGNQTTLNEKKESISSIVDMVKVTPCYGMGEYEVPYVMSGMEANGTGEGDEANNSDPGYGYAAIKPVKITTYTEVSEEAKKLTNVDYYTAVKNAAEKALRKKVARLIIQSGNDSDKTANFIGIKTAPALDASKDIESSVINEKTLRNLAMNYGSEEDVDGEAVLFLCKKDLIAFGDVRGTNEKKAVYEITPDAANTNTGIIKDGGLSVRYCLNSGLTSISEAAGAEDKLCMVYGSPMCFEVGLFGDYEVKVDESYNFKKGMLAIKGSVQIGGNVTVKDGFLRVVTKKTAA